MADEHIDDKFIDRTKKEDFAPKLAAADVTELRLAVEKARQEGWGAVLFFYAGVDLPPEKKVVFLRESEVTIGRKSDGKNTVVLELPGVSAHHCRVYKGERGKYSIADYVDGKVSTNGTFVNGSRVLKERELATGDVIAIADARAYFADTSKG